MKLALQLAEEFRGKTSPNPLVGAVVVKADKIVGTGAHQFTGGHHAEVYALEEAGKNSLGATLYVTLEPCCHYGKTPPCTKKIIETGISKVIVATLDPNPLVSGKGIQQLQEAGIQVEVGLCGQEVKEQNEVFFNYIHTKRPFVIAKAAISLDGKIATKNGDSKWISNELSRRKVHELRSHVDSVIIGKNTLLKDDPRLNVRLEEESEGPQKIVLMPNLDIHFDLLTKMNIYKKSISKPLLIVCHRSKTNNKIIYDFSRNNIKLIPVSGKGNELDLKELLIELGRMKITSLLLEGGSEIYSSFLSAGLINKFQIFQAPKIIGNDGIPFMQNLNIEAMDDAIKMKNSKIEMLNDNIHWELIP